MPRISQEEPWAKIPHWVVMCPELDASAIRVYAVLSKHANRARQSFPGLVRIADEACMSKTTVIKSLDQLEEAGAILVKRERASNNRHKVNIYHLPLNRVGTESVLPPSSESGLGSPKSVPPSSAESGQEQDLKNQLTRAFKVEELEIPRRPGETPSAYLRRIRGL